MKSLRVIEFGPVSARSTLGGMVVVILMATLLGCAMRTTGPINTQAVASREDLYILRSLREERTPKSTWCTSERAGFAPFNSEFLIDERFAMWSMEAQPRDGRITDAKANKVGEVRTCIGLTADPTLFNLYAEGQLASLSFTGRGDCRLLRPDYPEKGIAALRCYLDLRGLSLPYIGGLLTTNTLASKALLGGESDPPGYLQTSLATIRLWRAP
jgi:hypothetical protein